MGKSIRLTASACEARSSYDREGANDFFKLHVG